MPKQRNYKQDITPFLNGDTLQIGKSVFRFSTPSDSFISKVIGDNEIGLDGNKENLELHLYTIDGNQLVKSVRIPFSEGYLYVRNDSYNEIVQLGLELWNPENPQDTILVKYLSDVQPGFYNVVINFFSDEIGSYNNRSWRIKQISPTRKEIIIEPVGEINQQDFQQFVYDSIFVTDFDALLRIVFSLKPTDPIPYSVIKEDIENLFSTQFKEYYNGWGSAHQSQYESGLNKILGEIFISLESYTKKEREEGRFRITRSGFQSKLNEIVFNVVGNNLTFMPEGGTVIRNS